MPFLVLLGAVLLPAVLLSMEPTKEQMLLLLLMNNKQNLALRACGGHLKNGKSYMGCKCKAGGSL